MKRTRLVLALVATLVSSVASADYDKGVRFVEAENYKDAEAEFRPLAEHGDARSQAALGWLYLNISKDAINAEHWYRLSAMQGNPDGEFMLGSFSENGTGIDQDYVTAIQWFTKAAAQGHVDAMIRLSDMYLSGRGTPRDTDHALRLRVQAAEQDKDGIQATNLGLQLERGIVFPVDLQQAAQMLKIAAADGRADATYELGLMNWNGSGMPVNKREAFRLFKIAADNDYVLAMYAVGVLYEKGTGVEQDYAKARQYFNLAAGKNHPAAMRELAYLCEHGLGGPEEDIRAWSLYDDAANLGDEAAKKIVAQKGLSGTAAALRGDYKPAAQAPATRTIRYSDSCFNGDCVRTFSDGRKERFQAPYCFDALSQQWTWKPDGC